jgi:hypothetical protein
MLRGQEVAMTTKPPIDQAFQVPPIRDMWTIRGPDGKERTLVTSKSSIESLEKAAVVLDGAFRRLADK